MHLSKVLVIATGNSARNLIKLPFGVSAGPVVAHRQLKVEQQPRLDLCVEIFSRHNSQIILHCS